MRTSKKLALSLALVACSAVTAWSPALASADVYAPQTNAVTFATSAGGWTASTSTSGLCVPAVTCPIVSNSYVASGGAGGSGGFLQTSYIGLAAVGTTTNATWQSPSFVYNGNAGNVPTSVQFNLARRSNIAGLLGPGESATYNALLHNNTTNTDIALIPDSDQSGAANWTAVPTINVNPAQLTIGNSYSIRLTSTVTTIATVVPMGTNGWDNVSLTTSGGGGGGTPPPSGGGGGGQYGYYSDGIYNSQTLAQALLAGAFPKSAVLKGNKLKVRVKCVASTQCTYKVTGLRKGKKSKAATSTKKVNIGAGKSKKVTLKVKKKFLPKYQKAKKVFIRIKGTVRGITATVAKKVKLIKK